MHGVRYAKLLVLRSILKKVGSAAANGQVKIGSLSIFVFLTRHVKQQLFNYTYRCSNRITRVMYRTLEGF